jgi:hypothetical protein
MGIFYNPPQPPTANNAGTLPEPHAPIGTQGNAPPRYSSALMLVAVLASWPADKEPRLQRPNDQQQKVVTLTLATGDQPPVVGTASRPVYRLIADQWPLPLEPRLSAPNSTRVPSAPLTLTYGNPPSPNPPLNAQEFQAITAWTQPNWAAQSAPASAAWNVPPLVASVPNIPFPYPLILAPPATWSAQASARIAPLTLTYGQQPPTVGTQVQADSAVIGSAWAVDWPAQSAPKSTAWYVPPIVSSTVAPGPFPYSLILSSWPADLEPRLAPPNNRQTAVATFTLSTGQQPPVIGPMRPGLVEVVANAWQQTWDAQTAPKNAAWNVPPVLVAVPYAPVPRSIWVAWEPVWTSPPVPVSIATLTLPTGQQPPAQARTTSSPIIAAWATDPIVRPAVTPIAAVLPLSVGFVPWTQPPYTILGAWQDAPFELRRRVAIAPLTLIYGNQPPILPALAQGPSTIILRSWPADLEPRLGRPNAEQVRMAPLTLLYGNQPPASIRPRTTTLIVTAWVPPALPVIPFRSIVGALPPGIPFPSHITTAVANLVSTRAVSSLVSTRAVALDLPTYASAVLADGPDGYWRLGDAIGSLTAADSSGRGRTGTVHAGVTFGRPTLGPSGDTAALFDGTSGYISTGAPISLTPTFEAWVKPTAVGFFLRILNTGNNFPFELAIATDGTLQFFLNFTGLTPGWTSTGATLPLNVRTYVAMTWNGTTFVVYKNGLPVYSNATWAGRVLLSGTVTIGADSSGANSWWPGTLDECALYPRALSAAEIARHAALVLRVLSRGGDARTLTDATNERTVTDATATRSVRRV